MSQFPPDGSGPDVRIPGDTARTASVAETDGPPAAGDAIIDTTALDQIRALAMPGGPDPLAMVLDQFFLSTPALLDRLHSGAGSSDADAVRAVCHTLKSSMASLGATRLSELCRDAEAAVKAGAPDSAIAAVPTIMREVGRVEAALRAVRDGGRGAA
jgi:HPt (histidine-containing phosphotransfer) domain-containing protein